MSNCAYKESQFYDPWEPMEKQENKGFLLLIFCWKIIIFKFILMVGLIWAQVMRIEILLPWSEFI